MDLKNSNLPSVIINSEEKSDNDISHMPSIKSYAIRVFQESTIGIVSSIFTTHSKYRRVFKLFLSSLCVAGFIYCCVIFLNHVYEYPEVMDISQDRSLTYNMPAYTYCYNNPINRSVFCRLQPEHCEEPSEEFCKKYSSYCRANSTLVPKKEFYNRLPDDFQAEWILKFGSVPNVLNIRKRNILMVGTSSRDWLAALKLWFLNQQVGMCFDTFDHVSHFLKRRKGVDVEDEISGPYLRTFEYRDTLKACYSIHSIVESNQQPLKKQRRKISFRTWDEILRFYVDETEMMNPRSEPGIYFSVHAAVEVENPLEKGILLKGGRSYKLYVEMQEEVLLKAPFESNCMDYEELWVKNGRTGPRSKVACDEKCLLDSSIYSDGCAQFNTFYPHKEWICGDKVPSNHTTTRNVSNVTYDVKCYDNCKDECRSLKYTTEHYAQEQKERVEDEDKHRHIEVEIYLSNDEVKVIRHSPKYEPVEVISSIGGFMGCLLGIALMDILDVLGSVMTIFRYAFSKKVKKEKKKAVAIHVV